MSSDNTSVTVSVWNDFWSPQLVAGLEIGGFPVTHHTTGSQKVACARFVRNLPAAALNHLAYRKLLPSRAAHRYSRQIVDRGGAQLGPHTGVFWGWSGCSLQGLREAKAAGKLAILERGSTHCTWHIEKVSAEYKRLGLPLAEIADAKEIQYDLDEYKIADVICVPSNFVLKTFIEKGVPQGKLHVNAYGVDYSFWSQCEAGARAQAPFTFLWVATLMPRKGIAVLLEAWRRARLADAQLLLIGGIADSIKFLLKDLPRGVVHMPFLDHRGIRGEMARSHAYVLPSFEEGMARSVLEAAAAGLAPIITRETGATDILVEGKDAWVIPSGDSDALAHVLKSAVSHPDECVRRGLSAQQAVSSYTWEAYGARAASFLSRLVK
jgi:glycosyltransferase involved in cell wall biosynthesis